jgi:subtilisin family serine protease
MPRAGLGEAELTRILGEHGGKARSVGKSELRIVDLPATASEKAVVQRLMQHPAFKFAELDRRVAPGFVSNDPYFGSEWHLAKIGASSAWDTAQGDGVTIAILDSGVDPAHPDLASQLVPGWNFYDNNSNTADVNGHGTAVAGAAAAATNNGAGVASVAGRARLMPVRIADANAYAYWSTVAQGLTYAADHGVRVANISYVGVAGSQTVQAAAQYMKSKGGLVVVCAGNNAVNENIAPTTTMIPVSATDSNDQLTSFSSYGSFVAVAAPGIGIWTTAKGGGYQTWWGTSLASPITAGTIALMMSANPGLGNAQIESLLYSTAVDLGSAGRDIFYGYGRVNSDAAVRAAASAATIATTSDTQAPSAAISAPLDGSTVTGQVAINVAASDNVGVAKVELRVNGGTVATDAGAPYAFTWDSSRLPNGTATLVAVAYDAAGNAGTSAPLSITVSNAVAPLTVAVVNPTGGTVKNQVSVSTSASDGLGSGTISQSLYIDGQLKATAAGGSLSYNWNTRKVSAGTHTIQVVAKDTAGRSASATVQVSR